MYHFTKPQYSYKQASISCFVNSGPQMLTASVLMVLFEPLSHVCDLWYLKPTILPFLGAPRLAQNVQFGEFAIIAKIVGSGDPISYGKRTQCNIVWNESLGWHLSFILSFPFVTVGLSWSGMHTVVQNNVVWFKVHKYIYIFVYVKNCGYQRF